MERMIDLKKTIDERVKRIVMIAEVSARKIIKKEINKLKRDIIKQLKNG